MMAGVGRAVAAAAVLGLLGGRAEASGFALREQSAVGQGTSFAGSTARSDDPSFLFFNPAAIGFLEGYQAALVGTLAAPYINVTGGSASRTGALGGSPITGSANGDAGADVVLPAFYATARIAPDWAVGISSTTPWGLVTKYPADSIGRYHALTSSLTTFNIQPTISWRPLPGLVIGAGLQIQYADARLSNAVDFGALIRRPGGADGRATITGTDTSLGFSIGAVYEPIQGTRLGLSYRSAITQNLSGRASFEGVPAPLAGAFPASTRASAQLNLPDSLTFGVSHQLSPNWMILADVGWTNWSRFSDLTVNMAGRSPSVTEERWRDSWMFALGAEWRAQPDLRLRAGVAYDTTPVPDSTRTPRVPDADRFWLSMGGTWTLARNIDLSLAYSHLVMPDASVRLTDSGPNTANFLRGNLNMDYRSQINLLSMQVSFRF